MNAEQVLQVLQGSWTLQNPPYPRITINGNKVQHVLQGEVKDGRLAINWDNNASMWRIDIHLLSIFGAFLEKVTRNRLSVRDYPASEDHQLSGEHPGEGNLLSFKKDE